MILFNRFSCCSGSIRPIEIPLHLQISPGIRSKVKKDCCPDE